MFKRFAAEKGAHWCSKFLPLKYCELSAHCILSEVKRCVIVAGFLVLKWSFTHFYLFDNEQWERREERERQVEREREISHLLLYAPRAVLDRSQEPGTPFESPCTSNSSVWATIHCLPGLLPGSWVCSTGGLLCRLFAVGYGHPKWLPKYSATTPE